MAWDSECDPSAQAAAAAGAAQTVVAMAPKPLSSAPRSMPAGCRPRIVSLGAYCGVRKSVQKIGRDAEALPFDWMRTRIEGILHYMRTDFAGFFDYTASQAVPNAPVVVYRDHLHSFWHDDVHDELVQEKYRRRMTRFNGLDATRAPILFVRSVAHTRELELAEELLRELTGRFGERAMLLVIADFQRRTLGPVLVQDRRNLLVYYLPTDAHSEPTGAPYTAPLLCALDWVEGRSIDALSVPTARMLLHLADVSEEWSVEGIAPFADPPPAAYAAVLGAATPPGLPGIATPGIATPGSARCLAAPCLSHCPSVGAAAPRREPAAPTGAVAVPPTPAASVRLVVLHSSRPVGAGFGICVANPRLLPAAATVGSLVWHTFSQRNPGIWSPPSAQGTGVFLQCLSSTHGRLLVTSAGPGCGGGGGGGGCRARGPRS